MGSLIVRLVNLVMSLLERATGPKPARVKDVPIPPLPPPRVESGHLHLPPAYRKPPKPPVAPKPPEPAADDEITQVHRRKPRLENRWTFGGAAIRPGVDRDPGKLLPGFADRIELLFAAMRRRGHKPMLWEGYRSPERAAQLAKRGTGIARSMHCLGCAADIVHEDKLWAAPADFWEALGEEAERLGLTWGGRFKRADRPHVQAIPVHEQEKFRAMTVDERKSRVA